MIVEESEPIGREKDPYAKRLRGKHLKAAKKRAKQLLLGMDVVPSHVF
jgi:hypothetical protein